MCKAVCCVQRAHRAHERSIAVGDIHGVCVACRAGALAEVPWYAFPHAAGQLHGCHSCAACHLAEDQLDACFMRHAKTILTEENFNNAEKATKAAYAELKPSSTSPTDGAPPATVSRAVTQAQPAATAKVAHDGASTADIMAETMVRLQKIAVHLEECKAAGRDLRTLRPKQ